MSRFRAFTITDYETNPEWWEQTIKPVAKYYIYGKELCPTTDRTHYQGYIYLTNAKTLAAMIKFCKPRHVEVAKGTPQQNYDYCSKDENFVEFGSPPTQGARNDLERLNIMIEQGTTSMRELITHCSSLQSIRMCEILLKYNEPVRNYKTQVYWYYGATGTGKTRTVMEKYPDAYVCMGDSKWWEGYDGHEVVIIDDYRKDFCKFHILLRILDRYQFRVETKGASRQLLCKKLFITSNQSPREMWESRTTEDITQLLRRIDEVRLFK